MNCFSSVSIFDALFFYSDKEEIIFSMPNRHLFVKLGFELIPPTEVSLILGEYHLLTFINLNIDTKKKFSLRIHFIWISKMTL